jgi:hypothetical protein
MGLSCRHGRRAPRSRFPVRDLYRRPRAGACPYHRAGQAKINLSGPDDRPELVFVVGIKHSDMRRLMSVVAERCDEFLKEWERIHGTSD